MQTCELCSENGPLIKCSHVFPQWLNKLCPTGNRPFRLVSPVDGEYEQRSQTGSYGEFVCQSCETMFGKWDNHASKILKRPPVQTAKGWCFGEYDFNQMMLFYLSVLWRAHACKHVFFNDMDLMEHADRVGRILLDQGSNGFDGFEVIPSCSAHWLSSGFMDPRFVQIDDVTYCQLYMARFQAFIKVDDNPGVERLQPYVIAGNQPLCMLEKTFDEFGELATFVNTAQINMEKKNARNR